MEAYNLIAAKDIIYPVESDILIEQINPNELSISFKFKSDFQIFNDGAELKENIWFKLYPKEPENIKLNLTANNKNYFIDLSIVPATHYINNNQFAPGQFIINNTNISFASEVSLGSFVRALSEEDKRKANEEIPTNDPVEIFKTIRENTRKSNGTPSTKQLNSNGYDQYIAAKEGREKVWCANLADIYVFFLHAKGIPARRVNLWGGSAFSEEITKKSKFWFVLAPGHTVVEYYNNGWKFADLTIDTFMFTYKKIPLTVCGFKSLVDLGLDKEVVCHMLDDDDGIRGEEWLRNLKQYQYFRNSFNAGQIYTTFSYR